MLIKDKKITNADELVHAIDRYSALFYALKQHVYSVDVLNKTVYINPISLDDLKMNLKADLSGKEMHPYVVYAEKGGYKFVTFCTKGEMEWLFPELLKTLKEAV